MMAMARGFFPWASIPADCALTTLPPKVRNQPSAIWDRQELPVQRKSTFNGSGTALFSRSVGHVLQACPVSGEPLQVT
jgi:hypothetical protein